jgi:SPP1 gp7 family putative phage head morphogenesis protein
VAILQTLIEQKKRFAKFTGERYRIKKPAAIGYPVALEIGYRKKVRDTALLLTSLIEKHLMPNLAGLINEAKGERFDDYTDTLDRIVDTIKTEYGETYNEETIRRLASDQANVVSNSHRNRLTRILSNSIGIDVFLTEPYLATTLNAFTKENVALIESIPTDQLREVQQTVNQAIRSGKTTKDTEKAIRQRWGDVLKDKPKNRAELIARDQNGKLFGQLNHLRQTELGVQKYIWRTVRDARVRGSHADKDGKTFSWNKPPFDTGHPGEDFQCRCWAEPILTGLVELEEAA